MADPFSQLSSSGPSPSRGRRPVNSSKKTMIIGIIVALHVIPITVVILFVMGVLKFNKPPPPDPESHPEIVVKHIVAPTPPVEPPRVVPKPTVSPAKVDQWELPPVLPPAGMQPLIISGANPPPAKGNPLPAKMSPLIRDFEMKHVGPVNALAVVPGGKFLLSGGADRRVHAWDTATAKEVKVLVGAPHVIRSLAVNGTGGGAASGGDDGVIRVWNLVTTKEEFSLIGHTGPVRGVTFSPNGQYILSGGQDGTLRLWDVETREAVRNLKVGHPVTCVAFCPDGRRALVGADSGLIAIYDLEAATPLHRTTGHINAAVTSVAFSLDGREAVSVGDDKRLQLWDVVTGARIKIGGEKGPTGILFSAPAPAVAYAGDGSWAVAAREDSAAAVMQTHGKARAYISVPPLGKLLALAVAPDGSAAYFGTDQGAVRRMDFQGGADFIDTNAGQ